MPRLDRELVRRELVASRARALALIKAGAVEVGGKPATKASMEVAPDVEISLGEDPVPYVSRGGVKLAHALSQFGIDPAGLIALDLGASTGGFVDVLLAQGASKVFAVDVGHGQLHAALAGDDRVISLERTDVRDLTLDRIEAPDLVVADLAFISLAKALPQPLSLARPDARLVALVKPQFELEPGRIGKGGIVRKGADRREAKERVEAAVTAMGWQVRAVIDSPIAGGDGNREYLLWAVRQPLPHSEGHPDQGDG